MLRRLWLLLLLMALLLPTISVAAAGALPEGARPLRQGLGQGPQACDGPPIEPQESLAHALEERLQSLTIRSGPFEVSLTDREATSVLALRLGALGLKEPELRFLPGLACFAGRALGLLPVSAELTVGADRGSGRPEIQVSRARLGPVDLPPFVRHFLSGIMKDSLVRAPGVSIEHIELFEGRMTLRGRLHLSP